MNYDQIPSDEVINKTAEALKRNGMEAIVVENRDAAKRKVLELVPQGARIMNMTSVTLDTVSLVKEILESGKFSPVRNEFEKTTPVHKRELGAAPDWAIGSAHAVTQDGSVLIASNTGSQLPAYAYGADKVIWVVGAQTIVENFEAALKRIYEYTLPLEDARAKKAYGTGSNVSKLLVVNKEVKPDRIVVILVKEVLGF
jgi:hypothetical protein